MTGTTRRSRESSAQRPLALGKQRLGEVIKGAPTAVTLVALGPRPIVIRPPGANLEAVTSGTLERMLFPSECMDVGLTLVDVEELVNVREHRHR
jgi:hypothetical protein